MLVLVYYLSLQSHGLASTCSHARPGLLFITQDPLSTTSAMPAKLRIFDRGHAKRECGLESPLPNPRRDLLFITQTAPPMMICKIQDRRNPLDRGRSKRKAAKFGGHEACSGRPHLRQGSRIRPSQWFVSLSSL